MDDATHQPPAPEPDAKTRAPRSVATLDIEALTLTLDGVTYKFGDLGAEVRAWAGLRGLASRLQASDDPAAAWADLRAGKIPSHGPAKPKELDPWRRAYAHALADKQAKERGIKTKDPAFAVLLDECMQTAAELDRAGLTKAKRIAAVVTHWGRITGNEATL